MNFRTYLTTVLATLLLNVFWVVPVYANEVSSVRVWRSPENTRLVFDLAAPLEYNIIPLSSPDRLVIDLQQAKLKTSFKSLDLKDTPIVKIRHAVRNKNDLRVVLDLNAAVQPRSFLLKPNGDAGHRLVVDLNDVATTKPTPTVVASEPQKDARRDIVVAIDAGHGGEDPGASGPTKVREKHVVLAIAKQLQEEINKQPGYRAVLVRTGDYYVKHKRRWEKARENRADLFMSIHADAFTDPRAKGSSVYALSRKGTTSAMARFLANSENVDLAGEVSLGDHEEMVQKTLTDLVMTSSLVNSIAVGERIIGEMGRMTDLHSKRVELANFRVLKAPDIPSILIETGFISNPKEERQLNDKKYQKTLAQAITRGVLAYFEESPPMGTLIAWQKDNQKAAEHVIKRGDTLSKVAAMYSISVAQLKQENGLKSNVIHVGQTLRIPRS
ncbi:MAG: hypothetical protein RL336_85 [Pseudomonadota bacterium]|jgi:N-acetylmuramoyl-L-alanine amidase